MCPSLLTKIPLTSHNDLLDLPTGCHCRQLHCELPNLRLLSFTSQENNSTKERTLKPTERFYEEKPAGKNIAESERARLVLRAVVSDFVQDWEGVAASSPVAAGSALQHSPALFTEGLPAHKFHFLTRGGRP